MDPGISDSNMEDNDFTEEKPKAESGGGGFIRRLSKRFSKRKKREAEPKFEEITRPAGYEHEDLHTIMKRLKREIDNLKKMHRDWEQPAKRPKLDHDFREIAGHVYQYGNMIASRVGIPTVQKSVTDRLEAEIAELRDENRSLRNSHRNDRKLQDKDTEISRLKREIQTLQGDLNRKRHSESDQPDGEFENRRKPRGRSSRTDENGAPDTSKYVIHDLQETVEKDKTKFKEYESEIVKLKEEIASLKEDLGDSKDDNKQLSKRSGTAVKEVESLREQIQMLTEGRKEFDGTIARLHQQIEDQNEQIRRLHESSHNRKRKPSDDSENASALKKEVENLNKRCKEQGSAIRKNEDTIEKLRGQIQTEKKAKEEALARLSNAASRNMRNANPGITDLSDPDRPLKLAEKFTEFYDNEWTNAMENLEDVGKSEEESLTILLKIVVKVYELCKGANSVQMSYLPVCVTIPYLDDVDTSSLEFKQLDEIPPDIMRGIKEYRKSHVDQALPHLKKVIQKKLEESKVVDTQCVQACEEYIATAVKYCWLMVVQDPPIHMVWDFKKGCKFDNNLMRSYTQSGDIMDYVVWPLLYLHENGPLLSKGVMQGCKRKAGESVV